MKIQALKNQIVSGGKTYPIYISFIEAQDILKVSVVPNFSDLDSDETLANNLQNTPVRKWQRPLIEDKREKLTNHFNDQGEFMPNPVLLSENPHGNGKKIISNPLIINGQTTMMWEISLPDDATDSLWIIDGQHRINGLGHQNCKQKKNIIPVVLLLNGDGKYYSPTDFAKIFAQVTTTATSLNDLHKEWLEFSFKMSKYTDSGRQESMQTVIEMCSISDFFEDSISYPNPFRNNIVFNDKNKADNVKLNCIVLSDLIFHNYYDMNAVYYHLRPKDLAIQIEKAFYQLEKTISNPINSVFFSEIIYKKHLIMIKAFLKGILKYLLTYCDPSDKSSIPSLKKWEEIYKKLNFHITDWDWSSFTSSGSEWYKKSEELASIVMIESFRTLQVPDACDDLQSCIVHGNGLFLEFEFKKGTNSFNQIVSSNMTINRVDQIDNIKIINKSFNAQHISIVDKKTTANYPERFNMDYSRKNIGSGIDVPVTRLATTSRPQHYSSTKKFILEIKRTRYGGANDTIEIQFFI